jgi:hypothetical protein
MPSDAAYAIQDNAVRAERFDPDALAFEAFAFNGNRTRLLDPLEASDLFGALAETTSRWAWDRGDRLAIRELGEGIDRLHVYAVRRKSQGIKTVRGHVPVTDFARWLDPICSIDLNVVAGLPVGLIGGEHDLHLRRQHMRPEGARLERDSI